ncbi:MAG TPA: OsmC family peroxiredoxin [Methanosarcinales archaeon]|nr:OsmC family peroxiredoxin [Methanosarcinales archaeon]
MAEEGQHIFWNKLKWTDDKKGILSFAEARGVPNIEFGTPPQFGGPEGKVSPQDLYVASLNTCYLTTLLGTMGHMGISLLSYESEAEGIMERKEYKELRRAPANEISKITLRIKIKADAPKEQVKLLLKHTGRRCAVENSIKSEVVVETTIL